MTLGRFGGGDEVCINRIGLLRLAHPGYSPIGPGNAILADGGHPHTPGDAIHTNEGLGHIHGDGSSGPNGEALWGIDLGHHGHGGGVVEILTHAVAITTVVLAMMVLVEVIQAAWGSGFRGDAENRGTWRRMIVAVFLGAIPGCLGGFAAVGLYLQHALSIGGLVAAATASLGDEFFLMIALFPTTTVLLAGALALLGITLGVAADLWLGRRLARPVAELHGSHPSTTGIDTPADTLHHHDHGPRSSWMARGEWRAVWRRNRRFRGILVFALMGLGVLGVMELNHHGWETGAAILGGVAFLLFVTIVSDDHFLEAHLWRHVVLRHGPRLLGWMTLALAALDYLQEAESLRTWMGHHPAWVVVFSALIGLIPSSGPHVLVVQAFATGQAPLGALVANAITQEGHSLLPLFAHEPRTALLIKGVKLVMGLILGLLLLAWG